MRRHLLLALLYFIPLLTMAQKQTVSENRISSTIDSTDVTNVVLIQTFDVNVSIDSVWNAFTTKKGWESWATSIAEIDFKLDGLIRTNYNKEGRIGDESTITLHIINYIPKRMLTLQAELNKNFPEFMKADEKNLYNMLLFESIDPTTTRVTSYGIGYKKNEKYMSLMKFFIQGNAQSYLNLINYLETGTPSIKY